MLELDAIGKVGVLFTTSSVTRVADKYFYGKVCVSFLCSATTVVHVYVIRQFKLLIVELKP
jgi:hypothetical protein